MFSNMSIFLKENDFFGVASRKNQILYVAFHVDSLLSTLAHFVSSINLFRLNTNILSDSDHHDDY